MSEEKTAFFKNIGNVARRFESSMARGVTPQSPKKTRAENIGDIARIPVMAGAGAYLSMMAANKIKSQIQNDTRRKALIEDLYTNDSIISRADREDVLQYYATIYSVAPSISLDKNVVRELLQNFVKFGRVDIQTIKTMADTEKTMQDTHKNDFKMTDALRLIG